MPRKAAPKPDDTEQSKRFIEIAVETGADDESALARALEKIKPQKPASKKQRDDIA